MLWLWANVGIAENVLRVGVQLEPPNLDPTSGAAAAIDEVVYANLFEGLTGISQSGEVIPRLATNWGFSADGTELVFKLRRDVRFHDGTTFDAYDVEFTFKRLLAADSSNAQKNLFVAIRDIRVPDAYTITFELDRPATELPRYFAWGDAVIVAPETAAQNATRPVGTGPFAFARWRKGVSVELKRNPDYWNPTTETNLDGILFTVIPDPAAAYASLLAGEVDGFPNYPAPENLGTFANDARFKIVTGTSEGETILALNHGHPALTDRRVRRALSHAINKRAIIEGALYGLGTPIGSHFPPHHPAYIDLSDRYPYDPNEARALLAAAGFADGLTLSLKLPPPSYARRSGELVLADLTRIGINVEVENLEWAQWLTEVFANKNFDLTIVAHTEPLDYDIYARDGYYFQYVSGIFRELMQAIQATDNEASRTDLLIRAQTLLADDAVNVFLFQAPKVAVWRAGVDGTWQHAPLQANDFTAVRRTGKSSIASAADLGVARGAAYAIVLLGLGGIIWLAFLAGPRFVARRLFALILTLIVASLVIFVLVEVAPGDPATYMLGLQADTEAVAALRQELGLSASAPERYVSWISGLAQGDFGTSYTYRSPVRDILAERLSVSLPLALLAISIALLTAIPAGIVAARNREGRLDRFIEGVTQLGIALPNFWAAMLLVGLFGISLAWLPVGGFPGWQAGAAGALRSLLLPAIALALPQAAILCRVTRAAMIDTLQEDFIRTARAKGLSAGQTLRRHALRNASIPVLSVLGLQLSFLLAGGIIIENVFYLPGLGRLVFQAITQRDLIVVESVVLVLVFATVFIAFVVDLAYAAVDPRLRER